MEDLIDRLEALDAMIAEVVAEALTDGALRIADEAEVVHLLSIDGAASAGGSMRC